jgi:hypothetical protein
MDAILAAIFNGGQAIHQDQNPSHRETQIYTVTKVEFPQWQSHYWLVSC